MRKFTYDMFDSISPPTLILSTKYHKHLGNIPNAQNINCEFNMSSHQELSFDVYKELDGVKCDLWDQIVDFKYVYVPEHGDYYELQVDVDDSDSTVKHCVGVSAGESELSQKYLRDFHVNDETDILRDDYKVTVFYNPLDPEASLLDRVLHDKAPEWSIAHVDARIAGIQRTFTTDNSTIYDFLMNTVAKEIGCLFLYDSVNRTISAYDLYNKCNDCGFRGDFVSECPKCGSTDFAKGYGTWQNVYISPENYAESITVDGDADSVKNCFKIAGGDDLITATVANINPNKSNYIYRFSEEMLNDMPANLRQKLLDYEDAYQAALPDYEAYTEAYYEAIDQELYYQTTMMPETPIPGSTTAEAQLAILMASNFTVAVQNLNVVTVSSADIAVREYAKVLIDPRYTVTVSNSSLTAIVNNQRMWSGKFTVTSLGGLNEDGEEDTATSATAKNVPIIGGEEHYEEFLEQKIEKALDRSDYALMSIFNIESDVEFRHELTLYSLDRLNSFSNTYQSVLEILIKQGVADINDPLNDSYKTALYEPMYLPYYRRKGYIDTEAKTRQGQVNAQHALVESNNKQRARIQAQLNLKKYLGDSLYQIFTLYLREDTYTNSNYISDGLNNAEVIDKAKELFGVAEEELYKASELQYSLSGTLVNLMNTEEFAEFKDRFELGDWIICRADDRLYRLRLINVGYDYGSPESISVTFSNAFRMSNTINDMADLLNKADSMATSYDYVAHQASQGNKAQVSMAGFLKEGLDSTLVNVLSGENQEIVMDEHGMTIKQYIDTIEDYSPEQLKVTSNILAFTKDNWATASLGLGKHNYMHYDSINDDWVIDTDYGLSAMFVQAGYVSGSEIYGGQIYSTNYEASTNTGTHINLDDGSFNFGGNFTYNGNDDLKLGGFNVVTEGLQSSYITINANGEITSDYLVGKIDDTPYEEHHGEIFNTYYNGALPWAQHLDVDMREFRKFIYGNTNVTAVSAIEDRITWTNDVPDPQPGVRYFGNVFYFTTPVNVANWDYLGYEVRTGSRNTGGDNLIIGLTSTPPTDYGDYISWDAKIEFTDANSEYRGGLSISSSLVGNKYVVVSANDGWNANIKKLQFTNYLGQVNKAVGVQSHAEGNGTTARGERSHAEGDGTTALGFASHAEGQNTTAEGDYSHTEGNGTSTKYLYAHAEGVNSTAIGYASHAEGGNTTAGQSANVGYYTHAEGYNTIAQNDYSHSEGYNTKVYNRGSHAEGYLTTIDSTPNEGCHAEGYNTHIYSGIGAHAEGYYTKAYGDVSTSGNHVEGCQSEVHGDYGSHAEGYHTKAYADSSHTEGRYTQTGTASGSSSSGWAAHAEGASTQAVSDASHAEGYTTVAVNSYAHAEGLATVASGYASHAEGAYSQPTANYSHAEGGWTQANGEMSHSEGYRSIAVGQGSHSEGGYYDGTNGMVKTTAVGQFSHAEGQGSFSIGVASHSEGYATYANADYSHAEGNGCYATGIGSHAENKSNAYAQYCHSEGYNTTVTQNYGHSEGQGTGAHGLAGHSEGTNTSATRRSQHVEGEYNITDTYIPDGYDSSTAPQQRGQYIHIAGNGTNESNGNFITGNIQYSKSEVDCGFRPLYIKTNVTVSGVTYYAEYNARESTTTSKWWQDGNDPVIIQLGEEQGENGISDITNTGFKFRVDDSAFFTKRVYWNADTRSNAYTLDWDGNGVYAGKLTVGTAPTNNMDVATKQYVDNLAGADFTGATSSADGTHGLVPAPLIADREKYLKGDGTWSEIDVGSAVSITPVYNSGTKIADYEIDGVENAIYIPESGSSVIPNPPDPPTENLNSVSIDGTVYGILSGALYGITSPTPNLGVNGTIYVQYSATENVIKYVYCKINGIWMLFPFTYDENTFVDDEGNTMETDDGNSLIFVD